MAISHAFTNAVADAAGTLTVWYGATTATVAATDIVRPSDWNSAHYQYATITGNVAGQSTFSGTNIVIGGGPNVTISGVNATRFDISAGAGGAADGGVGISAGANSVSDGTVVFSNSNGISFGLNGSTVTAQHNALTTARASTDAIGLNTAQSNVTWTVNSAGLSLDARGYAGTGTTFNGASLSGSMTVNSNGVQLSLSAGPYLTTAMQSNAATISNIRVSAGTTSNLLSAVTFGNANGITFGLDASTVTASHNGLTSQSNQNVTAQNGGFAFQTLSFSNANGISFGTSAGSAITASHNAITTARASNDAIGLNTAQSNVTWTVNSSGLSLDARGYAGTGTTFNGANVSGSMTVNSVGVQLSLSAAAPGGGGETRLTAYAVSNTTQSSTGTIPLSSIQFAGAGIASVGITNGSVVISVPSGGGAGDGGVFAGVSDLGNTAGSTGTVSTGNFVLVGSNGITLSQSTGAAGSAATITIHGNAATRTMWFPFNEGVNVAGLQGQGTMNIVPVIARDDVLHVDRVAFPIQFSNATNSTGSVTITLLMGLYTKNASTLSLAHSTSTTVAWTFSGTVNSSAQSGIRLHTIPWTTTIDDGRYYAGVVFRSTTGGANATLNQILVSQMNSNFSGLFGVATNRSRQWPLGFGVYSASTTAVPGSIAFSQIDGTASLAARPPSWFMISGTV